MGYYIDCEFLNELNSVVFSNGTNSNFYKLDSNNQSYLLKIFNGNKKEIIEKNKIINKLLTFLYDDVNNFPIDIISISDNKSGYISRYYEDSINFEDAIKNDLSYQIRLQSTLDINKQLRFLHKCGFIYNDIRLSNNIISENERHGFLIDFEDMIFVKNVKFKYSYYRFYSEEYKKYFPPSKLEDVKKQFICNLSLLFNVNFEELAVNNDIDILLEKLIVDKEIYEFANYLLKGHEFLYFDKIIHYFNDEEKINFYRKKILKK